MENNREVEDKRTGWLANVRVGWVVVVIRKGNLWNKSDRMGFSAKVEKITPSGQIIVGNPGKPSIKFMSDGNNNSYIIQPYTKEWQIEKTKQNQLYYIRQWAKDKELMNQMSADNIKEIFTIMKTELPDNKH